MTINEWLLFVAVILNAQKYDVDTMLPLEGGCTRLLGLSMAVAPQVAMYLPRNADTEQVRDAATSSVPWSCQLCLVFEQLGVCVLQAL